MEKEIDVIYKDEEMYGFIADIVKALKEEIKLSFESDELDITLMEALEEAVALRDEDDNRFYKVWYNPMGAFVFEEMVKKEN